MKLIFSLILSAGLAFTAPVALSDVLLIDVINEEAPNSPAGIPRPSRGMNMDTVKKRFGEPAQSFAAVGEPPITRWDYDAYSVFFEHELVLSTVIHR
ncbi:MAG: hypothetical protein P8Y20_07355 [Gammaproteobacteria bacterium]|jgi:hypothetical protein